MPGALGLEEVHVDAATAVEKKLQARNSRRIAGERTPDECPAVSLGYPSEVVAVEYATAGIAVRL